MIKSYEDYKCFLEADRAALGIKRKHPAIIGDLVWKYEIWLRRLEYFTNCKTSILLLPYKIFVIYYYYKLSIKYNYEIPPNTFGPGLSIMHRGPITVNSFARIGSNCRVHQGTTIGRDASAGPENSPTIGNNVFIGPGAKIFGKIVIADNIAIGANSVVNKSFLEPGITIGGIPAKKISDKSSQRLFPKNE